MHSRMYFLVKMDFFGTKIYYDNDVSLTKSFNWMIWYSQMEEVSNKNPLITFGKFREQFLLRDYQTFFFGKEFNVCVRKYLQNSEDFE